VRSSNQLPRAFRWQDGERLVVFRPDAGLEAWEGAELFATARALRGIPAAVREAAAAVHEVPTGAVPEAARALVGALRGQRIVAWGGGRVIDTAKAVASARGGQVCAVPTTLSGAEMTRGHRAVPGHESAARVRPVLVLADPAAMESASPGWLRLSAMNALAHGAESLVTDAANPVASMAALRGAELLAEGLEGEAPAGRLALGSLLSAYAMDSAGYALHHVLCQTIVRTAGTDHAATNACMLPHTLSALAAISPEPMADLAQALGVSRDELGGRVANLAGGARRLSQLGVQRGQLAAVAETAARRPELAHLARTPREPDLMRLLESAW
jgi:alcohol dehydrogenase class IV